MDVVQLVGAIVRRHSKLSGLSQEQLMLEAGLDRNYISGIERKVKNPTITVVERVAKALRCSLGDFLD
jgi:transcriptional regulator with XRE-family HTH domain